MKKSKRSTADDGLTTYQYEAIAPNGTRIKGSRARMAAYSPEAVRRELVAQGFIPIEIFSVTTGGLNADLGALLSGKGSDAGAPKMKLSVLTSFTRAFHELLNAGISVPRALTTLAEDAPTPAVADLCLDLASKVSSGSSLADAFSAHPRAFDDVFIAYIAAGERTGSLPAASGRLAHLFERKAQMRTKVKSVATYPLLISVVIGVLVTGIMLFLVPQYEDVYSSFGAELPAPTTALIKFSKILPWLLLPMLASGVGAFFWLKGQSANNTSIGVSWCKFRYKMPITGKLNHNLALYRWATTLSGGIEAGLRVGLALELAAAASGSAWIRSLTEDMIKNIEAGRPLSSLISEHPGLFTPQVRTMVSTGEQAGELPKMLENAAASLSNLIDGKIATVGAQLEVLLLCVMGFVVGGLLIVLYLPILNLSSSIGETFKDPPKTTPP